MRMRNLAAKIVLLLLIIGIAVPYQVSYASTLHPTGLITLHENIPNIITAPKLYSNTAGLPSSVDLTNQLPAVGDQGDLESCVAFATGYTEKTYQEGLDWKWNIQTNNHVFSPSYIYSQIHVNNTAGGGGTFFSWAFNLLRDQGCTTLNDMPYTGNGYGWQTQVTEQQRINAAKHRTASWFQIADGDHNEIRAQLAAGNPVVIGIPVYPDFDNLNSGNPVYDNASGISRGAQAVCVIGYDDNKSALKFTNSWGTGWGINGYGWISYDFIKEMNIEAYFMSDINDSASINVTPSTCYATMTEPGKATVNWEAKIPSRINVSKDGEKEILFSEHPAGTFSEIANFILPGSSYVFNLYDYSNNTLGPLLSSVTCKGFRKGSTMIRRADEMEKEIREQMRGGKGSVEISHLFKSNEFYGDSVSLMAKVTLNKKCSIGLHQHEADQEAIYILQGKGRVTNNGKTYELSAGDAILTGGGGTHSIENVHNDPLVLLAVILVVDEPPHL